LQLFFKINIFPDPSAFGKQLVIDPASINWWVIVPLAVHVTQHLNILILHKEYLAKTTPINTDMLKLDQIRRVHVELTTRCNARCPMCPRNYRGYDFNSGYPLCELTLENFQHILTPEILKQIRHPPFPNDGFKHVAYRWYGVNINGNLGDFSLAKDGAEIVRYLVDHDVQVNITTNGSTRSPEWWAQLALPGVTVGFALDGLADTHSLYRQDTDWHRVMENAQALIAAGGQAIWRFIPFDHNRHQEAECRRLAQELGFVRFENIWDGRDRGPVYSRQGEFSHWIGANPDENVQPAAEAVVHHVNWFDPKTSRIPRDQDHAELDCAHTKQEEIYIAADGSVWPCCYLGFYPGQMSHPGNQQVAALVHENNALQYPLDHCLEWFDRVEQTWQQPNLRSGRLYACVNNCAKSK
jgi:sulfatase maturation enzyme AslB (radical SAM superfamily)